MRPIDADRLKDIISDTWVLDRIDEQPTIELLPTDFIPAFTITSTDGQSEVRLAPVIHGKWIDGKDMMYCSECSETYDKIYRLDYRYCPNCGALMEGVEE